MSFGSDPNPTEDKGKTCDCLGAGFKSVPLSLLGAQYTNKTGKSWGMVSLCPEAHLSWGTEKQGGASEPSSKHPSKFSRGRRQASGTACHQIPQPSLLGVDALFGSWHTDFCAPEMVPAIWNLQSQSYTRTSVVQIIHLTGWVRKTPPVWTFQHGTHLCLSRDTRVPKSSLYSKRDQKSYICRLLPT